MNNNFFPLTRFLRDRGFDAELLYPKDADHFLPYCDTYTSDYKSYTRELNWTQESFFELNDEQVRNELASYDKTIVCGYAAALMARAGIPIDVYIPYGSDIYKYAHLPAEFSIRQKIFNLVKTKLKYPQYRHVDMSRGTPHKYFKLGIQTAKYVVFADANNDFRKKIDKINLRGKRLNFSIPFIYTPQYSPEIISNYFAQSDFYPSFLKIRKEFDLVVFHHARHTWKTYVNDFTFKGNDKLIRGFSDFIRKHPDIKACLVMMEYGHDQHYSKELVKKLRLEKYVRWFPKMFRKDIMIGLYFADICAGEFDKSYLLFGVIMEGMAMEKTILNYRDDDLYKEILPEIYPLLNAKTKKEISEALSDYIARPDFHKERARQARKWFLKYVVENPLKEICEILEGH